jgi:hypothetical protein
VDVNKVTVTLRRAAGTLAVLLIPLGAPAQELEPGAYWPLPTKLNIFTLVNSYNWGDIAFDPALPIDDGGAKINTTALAFTRAFSLAGRSANAGVVVPIVGGHLEGLYLGEPVETSRFGLGDPRLRLAMNLYGAPAMTPKEFAAYRQGRIVGISVTVAPPLGEYDSAKPVNLGTNRWSFKSEIGFSQTRGSWVLEVMAGVWMFTDNTEFFGTRTRTQAPIVATQGHLTYKFNRSTWLAGDANFYKGGRTTVDGKQNLDLQRNSRMGATFSMGLGGGHAIRASLSRGAYTTIGADFTSIAFGYNYGWVR